MLTLYIYATDASASLVPARIDLTALSPARPSSILLPSYALAA